MRTFLSALAVVFLSVASFGQTQGVSQRATNGIAFGEMLVNNHINATNINTTNTFSGLFQQGQGTKATATGAAALGLNNMAAGSYSIAGGIGNTTFAPASLVIGRSNSVGSGAVNSLVIGNRNSAADFNSFVGGYNNQGDGSNTFVFGTGILLDAYTPNNFVIGHSIQVQAGSTNNFIWNSDPGSPLFVPDTTTNSFIVNAPGGVFINGTPYTNGSGSGSSITGMKTNQFTTNTVGVAIVGNVNFAGATNHGSGDWGVDGVFGTGSATAGALAVSGNATVNGTLSSSSSTSGVFTVTTSMQAPWTNQYAYWDGNGFMRPTNSGDGLTNVTAQNLSGSHSNSILELRDTPGTIYFSSYGTNKLTSFGTNASDLTTISNGLVTARSFSGPLSGNASTATYVTTSPLTNAVNVSSGTVGAGFNNGGAGNGDVPVVIYRSSTVVNDTGSSSASNVVSFTVPANSLGTNKNVRVEVFGDIQNAGGSTNLTLSVQFGSTVMWAHTRAIAAGGGARTPWTFVLNLSAANSTSSQVLGGSFTSFGGGAATTGNGPIVTSISVGVASLEGVSTETTTGALTFLLIAQWASISTQCEFKVQHVTATLQ